MSGEEEGAVAWLRRTIEGDKARAEGMAVLLGAEWATRRNDDDGFDYTVYGTDPDEPVADTWRVDIASWLADGDPRTVIADCEAKLAILDEHYILYGLVGIGPYRHGCVTCHNACRGGVNGYGICRTVKFLASGYRYWPGYREEDWKPGVTPWKAPSGDS